MTNTINVTKDPRGSWHAVTLVPYIGDKMLRITTMRRYHASLVTTVQEGTMSNGLFTVAVYADYFKGYKSSECKRLTAKFVATQHGNVLANINQIKADTSKNYCELIKLKEEGCL